MMILRPFTALNEVAAPVDEPNVDTNQLCPTRFNKVPRGPGHARILFHDLRFDAEGNEKPFVLNADPYRSAGVIVADRNFGCGSAREYAVWALYEFGIRAVIASSFGDIFVSNCYKNGLLPVVLSHEAVTAIRQQIHAAPGVRVRVDLEAQTVTDPSGAAHRFDINPVRKKCLLEGLDDVSRTQQYRPRLDAFVAAYLDTRAWLKPSDWQSS
jgi:3-isopropylmalate/(R)-2-methylmalate dehydratase small subunit